MLPAARIVAGIQTQATRAAQLQERALVFSYGVGGVELRAIDQNVHDPDHSGVPTRGLA